jgi:hypothetical protein
MGHLSVLNHGRPSISGSIRSIKIYSWVQYIVKKRCILCNPRRAGIGPLHPERIPPPHLPEVLGDQFISNLGPGWTGSYYTKESFQVSKREWDWK